MAERAPEWVVTEIEGLRRRQDALKDLVDDINGRLINVESLLARLSLPFSFSFSPPVPTQICKTCGAEIPKGFLSCPVCHMPVR